jgi:hypothetical protein
LASGAAGFSSNFRRLAGFPSPPLPSDPWKRWRERRRGEEAERFFVFVFERRKKVRIFAGLVGVAKSFGTSKGTARPRKRHDTRAPRP